MHRYKAYNGAMVTTAPPVAITTGAGGTAKTMLQIATPSTRELQVISWGYTLSSLPGGGTSVIELVQTDVAATVTAHVAAGIQPLDPNAPASLCIGGVNLTGYTATVEGATTATRSLDTDQISSAAAGQQPLYDYQFMPDERPIVAVSKFLRIRVTATGAVNMLCWVVWDE